MNHGIVDVNCLVIYRNGLNKNTVSVRGNGIEELQWQNNIMEREY
jgi:hypothetical protein